MRMRCCFVVAFFSVCSALLAQQDSVVFPAEIKDGIYLTYADFRKNNAVSKEQIITTMDRDQLEFIGKAMNQPTVSFKGTGGVENFDPTTAWGFFQNKTLYINFREEFYRVPVFGSICYLVATVTVINPGFYDPMFGYGTTTSNRTKEIREFIMNFYDGKVVEFNMDKAEELLSRDVALYAEYKQLGRRKQRDQVHRYIRRYNDLHPVYFLR